MTHKSIKTLCDTQIFLLFPCIGATRIIFIRSVIFIFAIERQLHLNKAFPVDFQQFVFFFMPTMENEIWSSISVVSRDIYFQILDIRWVLPHFSCDFFIRVIYQLCYHLSFFVFVYYFQKVSLSLLDVFHQFKYIF